MTLIDELKHQLIIHGWKLIEVQERTSGPYNPVWSIQSTRPPEHVVLYLVFPARRGRYVVGACFDPDNPVLPVWPVLRSTRQSSDRWTAFFRDLETQRRSGPVQHLLARGWQTWNTRSVLSHVLLPEGVSLNLGLKEYRNGFHLREALIGRQGDSDEQVVAGAHTPFYTDLRLSWKDIEVRVETRREWKDPKRLLRIDWERDTPFELVVLVTPIRNHPAPASLIVEAGLLWNRPGHIVREGDALTAHYPGGSLEIFSSQHSVDDPHLAALSPYLALPLDGPVAISTGARRSVDEVRQRLDEVSGPSADTIERFGDMLQVYTAVQTCLAWDTIYDPGGERAMSTVSRIWNCSNGGWALFCWDTYFAAYMASLDNRELAYANAIEMTREKVPAGFVPNVANAHGFKSLDRSQPPVGAMVLRELYRRFGDVWLLRLLFDDLLEWNRWWAANRSVEGLLAWGSNPYEMRLGNYWETPEAGVGARFGAALESGLDNSPMYDDIPYNLETQCLELQDVGLNGLYIRDCEDLADLATVIGRREEAEELRARAAAFRTKMQLLWDEQTGMFLNRRTDTGEFSARLSPTHFYALLGEAATPEQAHRMMTEHFYNPDEFWGEWMLPSIARSDPAYGEQEYWRGRIWAPMNFLVYLGLRRYSLHQPCADLAEKSVNLLLQEWNTHGHVHENYSAETGWGCDRASSDRFYHWGGLLGMIGLIQGGYLPGPEHPLSELG